MKTLSVMDLQTLVTLSTPVLDNHVLFVQALAEMTADDTVDNRSDYYNIIMGLVAMATNFTLNGEFLMPGAAPVVLEEMFTADDEEASLVRELVNLDLQMATTGERLDFRDAFWAAVKDKDLDSNVVARRLCEVVRMGAHYCADVEGEDGDEFMSMVFVYFAGHEVNGPRQH